MQQMLNNRELYARQRNLKLNVPKKVVIVGVGGIGTWLSLFCAMSGTDRLILVDPDTVEASNLGRLPFPVHTVGMDKVKAVRDLVLGVRPMCSVVCVAARTTEDMIREYAEQGYRIVDCTDDLGTQNMMQAVCPGRVRVGYDGGTSATVLSGTIAIWDDGSTGYEVTPSWVGGAVWAALCGLFKLAHPACEGANTTVDIGEVLSSDIFG